MRHIESVYGDDVLSSEVLAAEYVAVMDPVAWSLCRDRLVHAPVLVVEPQSLEKSELDEIAQSLPAQTQLLGVGGGLVIDATKYLALRDADYVPPILVPSISSSSAPFSDAISVRKGGVPVGMLERGAAKRVVVDYKLISGADARLNRAGYGDLLSHGTALADWRLGAEAGLLEMDANISAVMQTTLDTAISLASEVASVSRTGILSLMQLLEEASTLVADNPSLPIGAGSEHLLAWHLESTTGRHFIHGEIVALGIVVADYLQTGGRTELQDILDIAQVKYRLPDLGMSWEQLSDGLQSVADYNRQVRHYCSIFDRTAWNSAMLRELQDLVS